jgi:O-antigen/teichoic acid export membrane protein
LLKSNLIANFFGQAWIAFMGFAFVPLYIKYMGLEAYGLIGIFAVLQAWLGLLDIGMTPALGRQMALFTGGAGGEKFIRDLLRTIELIGAILSGVLIIGVGLGADWLSENWVHTDSLSNNTVSEAFVVMGAVAGMRLIETIYRSALIGLQRQVLFNLISMGIATVRGAGAVGVLIWTSPTITNFFLWQLIISILSLSILGIATYASLPKGAVRGNISFKAIKSVWHFSAGMMAITLLSLLLAQLDKVLLIRLVNLTEFGIYMLASSIAGVIFMLVGPVTQAFYPRICQFYGKGDLIGLANTFQTASQMVAVIAGSFAIMLIFFSEQILSIWTHDSRLSAQAAPILSLLIFGNLINGIMLVPYQAQLAYEWTSLSIKLNIFALLILLPALIIIIPRFGAVGAALVWILLNFFYLFFGANLMYRRILASEKFAWYRYGVFQPIILGSLFILLCKYMFPIPVDDFLITFFYLASTFFMLLTLLSATSPNIMRAVLALLKDTRAL